METLDTQQQDFHGNTALSNKISMEMLCIQQSQGFQWYMWELTNKISKEPVVNFRLVPWSEVKLIKYTEKRNRLSGNLVEIETVAQNVDHWKYTQNKF